MNKLEKVSGKVIATAIMAILVFAAIIVPVSADPLTSVTDTLTDNTTGATTTHTINFTTATTATIAYIDIVFPTGFDVSGATLGVYSGIGAGSISISGQTINYTVENPVEIAALTQISIALDNIVNTQTAGNYTVSVETKNTEGNRIDGPTDSATFTIYPSGVDVVNSTVEVSPSAVQADGASYATVTVTIVDNYNNPMPNVWITPYSDRGATDSFSPSSGLTNESGIIEFQVTSTTIGDANITVYFVDDWNPDGARTNVLSEGWLEDYVIVTFTARLASPSTSLVTVTTTAPMVLANGTDVHTVNVTALDSAGVPVPETRISLYGVSEYGWTSAYITITPSEAVTDASGNATFQVSSTRGGNATLTAMLVDRGVEIMDTEIVYFTPVVSAEYSVVGSLWTPPADGVSFAIVTATVVDLSGMPIDGAIVTFSSNKSEDTFSSFPAFTPEFEESLPPEVLEQLYTYPPSTVGGQASSVVRSTNNITSNITAIVEYPNGLGPVQLEDFTELSWWETVGNATLSAIYVPSPSACANGIDGVLVDVQAMDANGAPVPFAWVTLESSREVDVVTPISFWFLEFRDGAITLDTDWPGFALFIVTSTQAGTSTLTATIGGTTIVDTEEITFYTCDYCWGDMEIWPWVVETGDSATIEIYVEDVQGGPLTNQAILLTSSRGSVDIISSPVVTNESGWATATITSMDATTDDGVAMITAYVDDNFIDSHVIYFVERPAAPVIDKLGEEYPAPDQMGYPYIPDVEGHGELPASAWHPGLMMVSVYVDGKPYGNSLVSQRGQVGDQITYGFHVDNGRGWVISVEASSPPGEYYSWWWYDEEEEVYYGSALRPYYVDGDLVGYYSTSFETTHEPVYKYGEYYGYWPNLPEMRFGWWVQLDDYAYRSVSSWDPVVAEDGDQITARLQYYCWNDGYHIIDGYDSQPILIDTQAPEITLDLAEGSIVRNPKPTLSGTFSDLVTGVSTDRLEVDTTGYSRIITGGDQYGDTVLVFFNDRGDYTNLHFSKIIGMDEAEIRFYFGDRDEKFGEIDEYGLGLEPYTGYYPTDEGMRSYDPYNLWIRYAHQESYMYEDWRYYEMYEWKYAYMEFHPYDWGPDFYIDYVTYGTGVAIYLDGEDMTSLATISEDGFSLTPPNPLTEGTHTLTVLVTDRVGNADMEKVTFWVAPGIEPIIFDGTIELEPGWNFISVPYKLENPEASSVLNGIEFDVGYTYDPVTGWSQITATTEFKPLMGYWIHVSTPQTIPSTNLVRAELGAVPPSTMDLRAGWNAIGFTNTESMSAENALKSIDKSYTNIISWDPVNQEYEMAGINDVTGVIASNVVGTDLFPMVPCEGYWVFLTQDSTIAGVAT